MITFASMVRRALATCCDGRWTIRFLVIVCLTLGCGRNRSAPDMPPTIARLEALGTPHWMAVERGRIHVAFLREDEQMAVVVIDAEGSVRDVARSLPPGLLAFDRGELYVAGFAGSIGTVDPKSGAYTELVALGRAPGAMTARDGRLYVGAPGGASVIAVSDATPRPLAGLELREHTAPTMFAANREAVFALSSLNDAIFRIEGDDVAIIARDQSAPVELAANATHVAWTVSEGTEASRHLMATTSRGGAVLRLATAPTTGHIVRLAPTPRGFVYATTEDHAIYSIGPGSAPNLVAKAGAVALTASDTTVYWLERSNAGYVVRSAALP
jgi:hypothetical protein